MSLDEFMKEEIIDIDNNNENEEELDYFKNEINFLNKENKDIKIFKEKLSKQANDLAALNTLEKDIEKLKK